MKQKRFNAYVVALDNGKKARVTSSEFLTDPEGESIKSEETFPAKVTLTKDRNGNLAYKIRPYDRTGKCRYRYLLNTKYGCLKTTKREFLISFRFPRKDGILAATRHLISDTARLSILMCNEFFNHNEQ